MKVSLGPGNTLQPGDRVCTTNGGVTIVVFNLDGKLYALDAVCGHRGGPLDQGVVSKGIVTCPWHLHRYDIKTGERTDKASIRQETYPVSIEDDEILVEVPATGKVKSMRELLLEHAKDWDRDA